MRPARRQALLGAAAVSLSPPAFGVAAASATPPVTDRVAPAQPDALQLLSPGQVRLGGWLGARVDLNAQRRLLHLDMQPLLAGFVRKPGSHPWIGEHVGKWMHAATLAWAQQGDAALRRKLDRVALELMATQEADGYLGTYRPDQRFGLYDGADWDVWSHKYCMAGLLTYHRHTGHAGALQAARRAADLLLQTFPARRSILAAGTHKGLASTSVLEPVVDLYRLTGDSRYLDFARYVVSSWDEPGGPAVVATLLSERQVDRVKPPKAYELLSNLVGLAELVRVTGDRAHLTACLNAWQDIVDKRLFISGGTSQDEHFQADHVLQDNGRAHVSETCVTTTWIQFNLVLLQLTGDSRFAAELERSTYNHLTAAQNPNGEDWCYFTPLRGRKPYLKAPEITCCQSSGPRGLALAPQWAYLKARHEGADLLVVNTVESSAVTLELGGQRVTVEQDSGFPRRGERRLRLRMAAPARFGLRLRKPDWAPSFQLPGAVERDGWLTLAARDWRDGDELATTLPLASALVPGRHGNAGKAALKWGPFVLALDEQANPDLPAAHRLAYAAPAVQVSSPADRPPLRFSATLEVPAPTAAGATVPARATLQTYADAGAQGGTLRVWLKAPGQRTAPSDSLLFDGVESRSRGLTPSGKGHSFNDDDAESWVSTYDGTQPATDWFAITLDRPVAAQRFVFVAGAVTDAGGWFDVQGGGKPQLQVKDRATSAWRTIGRFDDYPDTTASDAREVGNTWVQAEYTLRTPAPVRFVAVRVLGRPAGGRDPARPYVTCAALQAFGA